MASVSLVACSTQEGTGTGVGAILGAVIGGAIGGERGALIGAAVGALAGNRIGAYLDKKDQEELNKFTAQNIGRMKDGETVNWSNPDKEISVDVTAEGTDDVTREVAFVRYKDVDSPGRLDVIGAPYEVSSSTAYVLSSPGVGGQILRELNQGTGVWVIGSVPGKDWLYVERDGIAIGYIAAANLKSGTDDQTFATREATLRQSIDLAEADDAAVTAHFAERGIDVSGLGDEKVVDRVSASSTCRDIKYDLRAKDASIEESVKACKAGDGAWEVIGEG
jgi:surface antigen